MPWNYFCAVTFTNHFPRWLYSLNSCEYSARHFSLLPKKNLPARRSDSSGDAFVRSSSSHRKRFSCTPWMKNAFRYRFQKNNQFQRIIFFRMRMGKNEWINGKWKTKSYGSGFTMWQFLSLESDKQTDRKKKKDDCRIRTIVGKQCLTLSCLCGVFISSIVELNKEGRLPLDNSFYKSEKYKCLQKELQSYRNNNEIDTNWYINALQYSD